MLIDDEGAPHLTVTGPTEDRAKHRVGSRLIRNKFDHLRFIDRKHLTDLKLADGEAVRNVDARDREPNRVARVDGNR